MLIAKNVRTSFNQDGAVLMDIHGGSMLTLNPIGSIIWKQLGNGRSPVQIAENLASEFSIPREQALADVNEFIQQLEARQLIRPSESENPPANLGWRPWGLVCNLFGWRQSHTAQGHDSK